MYTYEYIVKSLPKNKSSVSSFWVKAVARPLSFFLHLYICQFEMHGQFYFSPLWYCIDHWLRFIGSAEHSSNGNRSRTHQFLDCLRLC